MIPWWLKIMAKIILKRLPINYNYWRKLGIFRHGKMDSSEYAINVFNKHLNNSGFINNLKGKVILELGPGDSIATALISYAMGAKAILIDSGYFITPDLIKYKYLVKKLSYMGYDVHALNNVKSVDEILNICNAKYYYEGISSLKSIKSSSVDLIFSQAVLEHVRKSFFIDTIKESFRIIKKKGICSHKIDLKDHLGGGLNNLRFSEKIWESSFFSSSGFYTNRIRYNDLLKIFKSVGFNYKLVAIEKWDKLPLPYKSLNKEFQAISENILLIKDVEIILSSTTIGSKNIQ